MYGYFLIQSIEKVLAENVYSLSLLKTVNSDEDDRIFGSKGLTESIKASGVIYYSLLSLSCCRYIPIEPKWSKQSLSDSIKPGWCDLKGYPPTYRPWKLLTVNILLCSKRGGTQNEICIFL